MMSLLRGLVAGQRLHRGLLAAAFVLLAWAPDGRAQIVRESIPSPEYLSGFSDYYDGNYRSALDIFSRELKSGIRTVETRWIDSICYHTMTGECYYQLGDLGRALEQYNAALELYNAFFDWMIRVQFPPGVRSAGPAGRIAVPWGRSNRRANIGVFPETMSMSQGQVDSANRAFRQGGTVQAPVLFPVRVTEIVRCTALAIRRRYEILGPICKYEPLTGKTVASLSRRSGPPNHWSSAWVDLQAGVAFRAAGETARAATALERSILVGGEFDHPLACVALLELGKIALESGDFKAAATFFEEATYSATNFSDGEVLEEAFRWGQMTHLAAGEKGVYPPLSNAIAWAKSKGHRQLHVSLALLACENLVVVGDTRTAATMLAEAKTSIRGDMSLGSMGAKFNLLTAQLAYDAGKVPAGDQAVAAALEIQKLASKWLFQINYADRAIPAHGKIITDRVGLTLYDNLLREPTAPDWTRQPLDALTVLAVPHPRVYENWFELALKQGNRELALEISDRIRRHRFYGTLPMGGRLLALRWLLEAPEERLSNEAKLQRQDLLVRYPKYQELSAAARRILDALGAPAAEEGAQRKAQAGELAKLAEIGEQQELILRSIAVRREPAQMMFPPLRSTKDVQQALPKGHLLMSFLSTEKNLYGFVFSRDRYDVWQIASKPTLKKQVIALLRELGNYDQNHELANTDFAKAADWQKGARLVLDNLLKKSKLDFGQKFDELIVVPDDFLWYLPFELLPSGRGDDAKPMLTQTHVRYAPTVGLALPIATRARPKPVVGVVVGKLHPRDEESVALAAFQQLSEAVPGAVALSGTPPVPTSVYRMQFDTLLVLDDIKPAESGPYDWSPGQFDRGKPGSQLAAWMNLPWGGPRCVVLPGFHTHAENSLKKTQAAGTEMFLATCGLMATGTETILISRWRTGGQISFDLMRQFVQELPSVPPTDAWQRAVQFAAEATVDSELEPRVKSLKGEAPKGNFPFFWAGYALVDSGVPAEDAEPAADDEKIKAPADLKAEAAAPAQEPLAFGAIGDADAAPPAGEQAEQQDGKAKPKPVRPAAPKRAAARQKPATAAK